MKSIKETRAVLNVIFISSIRELTREIFLLQTKDMDWIYFSTFINFNIMGRFDYTKLRFDSYKNNKFGPFSIFGRIRFEALDGDPPNQELLGIYDIPNFYIMGVSTPGREYMSPRGYRKGDSEYYQGNRAYMGTLELRTPVLPISVFESLKVFKIGMPSFCAVFRFWKCVGKQL